jgi:hypothetical protein
MELSSLTRIRQGTLLTESVLTAIGKAVAPMRMTWGTEHQRSSMKLNDLSQPTARICLQGC